MVAFTLQSMLEQPTSKTGHTHALFTDKINIMIVSIKQMNNSYSNNDLVLLLLTPIKFHYFVHS